MFFFLQLSLGSDKYIFFLFNFWLLSFRLVSRAYSNYRPTSLHVPRAAGGGIVAILTANMLVLLSRGFWRGSSGFRTFLRYKR